MTIVILIYRLAIRSTGVSRARIACFSSHNDAVSTDVKAMAIVRAFKAFFFFAYRAAAVETNLVAVITFLPIVNFRVSAKRGSIFDTEGNRQR